MDDRNFLQAGGRFREMYYWDSYWILRGLLLCDMAETARGIVENIIWLVKLYGHMPNGSRKYYLQRSQPPLLIQMAATYHSWTKDDNFIKTNIKVSSPNTMHFLLILYTFYDNNFVKVIT